MRTHIQINRLSFFFSPFQRFGKIQHWAYCRGQDFWSASQWLLGHAGLSADKCRDSSRTRSMQVQMQVTQLNLPSLSTPQNDEDLHVRAAVLPLSNGHTKRLSPLLLDIICGSAPRVCGLMSVRQKMSHLLPNPPAVLQSACCRPQIKLSPKWEVRTQNSCGAWGDTCAGQTHKLPCPHL